MYVTALFPERSKLVPVRSAKRLEPCLWERAIFYHYSPLACNVKLVHGGEPGRLEARGPAQLHPAVECESGPEASVRIVLILSEQANPSIA